MSYAAQWRLLQWLDSAFPTGAYAHSGGLEAWAHVAPKDADVTAALRSLVGTQAQQALPFVRAAFVQDAVNDLETFDALDAGYDANVWGSSANRASRAQGRALLQVTLRSFGSEPWMQSARSLQRPDVPLHLPVVFGALGRAFTADEEGLGRAYSYCTTRALASAAVRLNLLGPFEAQRVLATLAESAEASALAAATLQPARVASASPWLDLIAEQHEHLHTRLFAT